MAILILTLQPSLAATHARLCRPKVDGEGIKLDIIEKKDFKTKTVEFTIPIVFKDGDLEGIDDLQVDFYADANAKAPLQTTGPLIELSQQIEDLGEAVIMKKKELKRIVSLGQRSTRTSGGSSTILEMLDAAFDNSAIKDMFADPKKALDTLDLIGRKRDSFDFVYTKIGRILKGDVKSFEWSNAVTKDKTRWYAKRYLRKYLLARKCELRYNGNLGVWFALVDGRVMKESFLTAAHDQAFIIVNNAIINNEVPIVNLKTDVPPVLEAINKLEAKRIDEKVKDKNVLKTALDFMKESFVNSTYNFDEASKHITALITQQKKWDSSDIAGMQRSIIDGLIDFTAAKEAMRVETDYKNKVPPPANSTKLNVHKEQARKASNFVSIQNRALTELFGIAASLSNNFTLLDQIIDIKAKKGSIGKVKFTAMENVADVSQAEWKAWLTQAQASVLTHLGIQGKNKAPTPELQAAVLDNYAQSVFDLTGKLYPNRRFVAMINGVKLPANWDKASWDKTQAFLAKYGRDINITSCSIRQWNILLSQGHKAAELKEIEAIMPEIKAWQLAHAVLPDPHDHTKAVKVREAALPVGIKASPRNVIRDLMTVGEVKFVTNWLALNSDPQKDPLHKKLLVASEGASIFKKAKRQVYYKFLYSNGQATDSTALNLSGGVSTMTADAGPLYSAVLGLTRRQSQQITWDSLFSGKDYCACDEDESLLSAAAYLVEQLNWLKSIQGGGVNGVAATTAYDETLKRRPDLIFLALSKQNTFTTLPYIDIVNELLERKLYVDAARPLFAKKTNIFEEDSGGISHIETNGTSDDRNVQPEIVHLRVWLNAYKTRLMGGRGIYLPFDYWVESAKRWLVSANTSLHEIKSLNEGTYSVLQNANVLSASRDFGLSGAAAVINGALHPTGSGEYVGLSPSDKLAFGNFSLQTVYATANINSAAGDIPFLLDTLIAKLPMVQDADSEGPGILDRQLPREDVSKEYFKLFREILETRFVQSTNAQPGRIKITFTDDECSIDSGKAKIENHTLQTFANLFGFCKLLGKLQWRPWQLDLAIQRSGNVIDNVLFNNIDNARRIQDIVNISHEEMLCLCFGFYSDKVFDGTEVIAEKQHKEIFNMDNSWRSPMFTLLAGMESNTYPQPNILQDYSYWNGANNPATFIVYDARVVDVARVFGITVDELHSIAASLNIARNAQVPSVLTPLLLQQIYKLVTVAKALRMPVQTLCSLPDMRRSTMDTIPNTLLWLLRYQAIKERIRNYPAFADLLDQNRAGMHQTDDLLQQRTRVLEDVNENVRQVLEFFASTDTVALENKHATRQGGPSYLSEIGLQLNRLMPPLETGDYLTIINSLLASSQWPNLNAVAPNSVFNASTAQVSPENSNVAGPFANGHFIVRTRADLKLKVTPVAGANVTAFVIGTTENTALALNAGATEYTLHTGIVYYISVTCTGQFTLDAAEVGEATSIDVWYFSSGLVLAGNINFDRNAFLNLFYTCIFEFTRLLRLTRNLAFDQHDLRYLSDLNSNISTAMQTVDIIGLVRQLTTGQPLAVAIERLVSYANVRAAIANTELPVTLLDGTILPYIFPGAGGPPTVNNAYALKLAEALNVDGNTMTSILSSYRFKDKPVPLSNQQSPPMALVYDSMPEVLVEQVIEWTRKFRSDHTVIIPLLDATDVRLIPSAGASYAADWSKKETAYNRILIASRKLAGESIDKKQRDVEDKVRRLRKEAMLDFFISGNRGAVFTPPKPTRQSFGKNLLVPIDIEPIRKTSRIREAISAIQRFVLECKNGEIPHLRLSATQEYEWETFRKEFRIWQVAKIILRSPEDYLLPRLRIDKTPIYAQAESELEQDEATQDVAEKVLRNYVTSLHDISSLEVTSVISHTIITGEKFSILIGRTRSNPHKYFFAVSMESDESRNWSPWYEINIDIEGDHILPVIHQGYLYVFWPDIKVAVDRKAKEDDARYKDLDPGKFEVRLNYTRLEEVLDKDFPKRIKWTRKKQSKSSTTVLIESTDLEEKLDLENKRDRIFLSSQSQPGDFGDLHIHVNYWEALKEGVHLIWNRQLEDDTMNEIRAILTTQISYAIRSGTCAVDVRQQNNVSDLGEGGPLGFIAHGINVAAEEAYDSWIEITGQNVSTYTSPSIIPSSYYINWVKAMFFSSNAKYGFDLALDVGNRYVAEANLDLLIGIATILDAGTDITVTYRTGATTIIETTSIKNTGKSLVGLLQNLQQNIGFDYGNSYGSLYELYRKGKFALNACGDLHITESQPAVEGDVVPHSDSHETMETIIRSQRLHQNTNHVMSVWRDDNTVLHTLEQDTLFHNTPTRFALAVDPSSMPFRISKDNENNFVFQDANHAFLIIPSVVNDWVMPGGTFVPYIPQTSIKVLVGNKDLSGYLRTHYAESRYKALAAAGKAQFGSEKYGVPAGQLKRKVVDSSARTIFAQAEAGAKTISSRVADKASKKNNGILSIATGFKSDENIRDTLVASFGSQLFDKNGGIFGQFQTTASYKLLTVGHPFSCDYLSQVSVPRKGIDLLYQEPEYQGESNLRHISLFAWGATRYDVHSDGHVDYSQGEPRVYFEKELLFSRYNHELFFHLPFRIAVNFADNGRFEEALKWFHYIFDPRRSENRTNPWGFIPFRTPKPIPSLANRTRISIEDPFNPYAQAEINQQVYMKAIVYKYLDALIAYADSEFLKYTGESLDTAELLYRNALALLGRPPQEIVKDTNKRVLCYDELYQSAAIDDTVGAIATEDVPSETVGESDSAIDEVVLTAMTPENYFCHSSSSKLNDYFVLINQRLFNLNNSRDINGNLREVALFQPPISPWLLIMARAAGLDIGAVLGYRADAAGYRWEFLQQKAVEHAELAARFADKLQAALEKKDSGALTLLRESHQKEMLKSTRELRRMNIRDAEIGLKQVERSKESVEHRLGYYAGREKVNSKEREEVEKNKQAFIWDITAQGLETLTAALAVIPQMGVIAGPAGGATTDFGGQHLAQLGHALSASARMGASILRQQSYLAGVSGGRQRRWDDWQFQANSARKELKQIEQQILAAQMRISVAEHELESVEQQQEQSDAVLDFMRNQFTSEEFYEWQVKDIMTLFRQSYNMAFDMAKRAEAAYLRDTLRTERLIQAGNWLSDRKGLGSTDKLLSQLKQLDQSYWLNINPPNQVSKRLSVSLALNFPDQLATLITTGICAIDLQGFVFDMHWPDHYYRRIKSVAITIPCVRGPFVPINARLKLLKGNLRTNENATGYADNTANYTQTDPAFRSFAETNNADQDTGRLQFDDGNRLLNAFEGAGLDDSDWTLEVDRNFNRFDLSTISDVILTFEFTALVSNQRRTQATLTAIKTAISNSISNVKQLISLRGFFGLQWEAFKQAPGTNDTVDLNATLQSLVGLPLNTMQNPSWRAYYIMGNDKFDEPTYAPYVIQQGDFINAGTGSISLRTIWDNSPVPQNERNLRRANLRDIVIFYQATPP